jgi:hypothetical protein
MQSGTTLGLSWCFELALWYNWNRAREKETGSWSPGSCTSNVKVSFYGMTNIWDIHPDPWVIVLVAFYLPVSLSTTSMNDPLLNSTNSLKTTSLEVWSSVLILKRRSISILWSGVCGWESMFPVVHFDDIIVVVLQFFFRYQHLVLPPFQQKDSQHFLGTDVPCLYTSVFRQSWEAFLGTEEVSCTQTETPEQSRSKL